MATPLVLILVHVGHLPDEVIEGHRVEWLQLLQARVRLPGDFDRRGAGLCIWQGVDSSLRPLWWYTLLYFFLVSVTILRLASLSIHKWIFLPRSPGDFTMDEGPSLLTGKQREFLLGNLTYDGEHAKQQRYQRRQAIRKRLKPGFLHDIPLVENALDEDHLDVEDIVEDVPEDELGEALAAHVSLIHRLAEAGGVDVDRVLEEGEDYRASVLYERFQEDPRSLTISELQHLQEAGKIRGDEVNELLDEKLRFPGFGMTSGDELSEELEKEKSDDE